VRRFATNDLRTYTWRNKSPPFLNLEDLKDRKGSFFRFLRHNCGGGECAGIKRSKTFEVFEVFAVQFLSRAYVVVYILPD
jgi:hypothetical protein